MSAEDQTAFRARVDRLLDDIQLAESFQVHVRPDPGSDRLYMQVWCWRPDTFTGEMDWGRGGKAYLSPHATDSELVQTAFGLYKAYVEHEARESFLWRGRRVFGPHISTEALWEVAERYDARPAVTT